MLSIEEIRAVFKQHYFDGMGSVLEDDVKFLCDLIQHSQPKKCFEAGVASGMSTTFLLKALAKLGSERELVSVDISKQYYADRSKQVGYVVDAELPQIGCEFGLHFNCWSGDIQKLSGGDKFDFVFIDAHHSHPWPTLDTMLVLPFVNPGTWIAHHDIALKDRPGFARETGPFNVYEAFAEPKKRSQAEVPNIGAFQITGSHGDYQDILLSSLEQNWTVSGVIKASFYNRIFEMLDQFYSRSFATHVRQQIESHNQRIETIRKNKSKSK